MTIASRPDCLFCRIVAGDVPGDIVERGARTLAFRDVSPVAPVHVLVVPFDHHADLASLAAADPELTAELMTTAAAVAGAEGLAARGYRIVLNTGSDAGQTVGHVHAHVLGGRSMGWPPG